MSVSISIYSYPNMLNKRLKSTLLGLLCSWSQYTQNIIINILFCKYQYPVLGVHCSWNQYPQTASKQQRCSQVCQFTLISPCFQLFVIFENLYVPTSSSLSGFRIKAQKKQKTMRKNNIQCDLAPYRFMYKRDNDKR